MGANTPLSTFDLNLLNSLDALLRERNVTAAAKRIGVSQPTMSGMLNRLREQLKDPLLIRVGRAFELTPRGRELVDEVRQTLLMVENLSAPRKDFELERSERNVRIMASEFTLFMILPDLFRRAADVAPHLTFEVISIEKPVEQVYSGNVDICITGDTIADIDGGAASAIRTQTLAVGRFVAIVDASHPLSGSITLEQFLEYPRVSTQFPGIPRTVEDNLVPGVARAHPPRIRVPSSFAIGSILIGTDMIGIIPSKMTPLLPSVWTLRTLALPADFGASSLRALWHSRHDHDPIHQWIRATIAELCSGIS